MLPTYKLSAPTTVQLLGMTVVLGALLAGIGAWSQLKLGDRLLPHAFCIAGSPSLLLLHLISDTVIAIAYLAIPCALFNIARRRRDIPFGWVAWLFGAFIIACGITHAFDVLTLYYPVYWLSGVAKAFTGAVSLGTAYILFRLTPAALALPSSADLRSANEALCAAQAKLHTTLAELRRTDELLQTVLSTAHDGVIVADDSFRPITINAAARRLFEVNGAPGEGEDFLSAVEEPDVARQAIRDAGPNTTQVVLHVKDASGNRSIVEASVSRFNLDGRRLITLVGRDATRRRAAEDALVRSNQSLQQFAFSASHDLRSPLLTIGGIIGLIRSDLAGKLSPLHEELFQRVGRAVTHMSQLTADLLTYARTESAEVSLVPVSLTEVAAAAQGLVREQLSASGGEITIDPLPIVLGNATQLTQLFVNMFDNSIKYRSSVPPRITVCAEPGNQFCTVVVTDNGIGVAPEHRSRIFDIFTRLHRQDEIAGTGIGLAISKRIAERHGGTISVDSAPGGGTAFSITLPVAPVEGDS